MNTTEILIDNQIETLIRSIGDTSAEYVSLYFDFESENLQLIFSTIHSRAVSAFERINLRIPKDDATYFWADPSRDLIWVIDKIEEIQNDLYNSRYTFTIDRYYKDIFNQCKKFISPYYGSTIPVGFKKVRIPYKFPLVKKGNSINIEAKCEKIPYHLKPIGSGSYASVYMYYDEFYGRKFAFKKAKNNLNDKEIERFKREYDITSKLKSPYIVEVYRYIGIQNAYIMEYMDCTLDEYIHKNNSKMNFTIRKSLALQTIRAFEYIHSRDFLHRDISPKNILLKLYHDIIVVKVADFGLVKIPSSTLTSKSTDFKGYFNDPNLQFGNFYTYSMLHETYALTRVIYYILSGRVNIENIRDSRLREFVYRGLGTEIDKRYKNVQEMKIALNCLWLN